ncbi:hypothetical protein P153DRAFT_391162 [Dothidotthia symphoricarpi CBS 119687]|uniref:Uncharacterized protein n=1 Tax=Dothidotthia symphoricarpi CBS 119687 TaxID=1392245 RepID=A0A6A5ZXJ9_9PLEO|nr:uncharacterized protein P153DRAFT_391162 [Dothidotthia symphoricarpi CBS 119687]KAF2123745.1 hypothetical protein P153DRAFT_391162 [Dothidotthia symphoricarpi CBS 119687]
MNLGSSFDDNLREWILAIVAIPPTLEPWPNGECVCLTFTTAHSLSRDPSMKVGKWKPKIFQRLKILQLLRTSLELELGVTHCLLRLALAPQRTFGLGPDRPHLDLRCLGRGTHNMQTHVLLVDVFDAGNRVAADNGDLVNGGAIPEAIWLFLNHLRHRSSSRSRSSLPLTLTPPAPVVPTNSIPEDSKVAHGAARPDVAGGAKHTTRGYALDGHVEHMRVSPLCQQMRPRKRFTHSRTTRYKYPPQCVKLEFNAVNSNCIDSSIFRHRQIVAQAHYSSYCTSQTGASLSQYPYTSGLFMKFSSTVGDTN